MILDRAKRLHTFAPGHWRKAMFAILSKGLPRIVLRGFTVLTIGPEGKIPFRSFFCPFFKPAKKARQKAPDRANFALKPRIISSYYLCR